MNPEDLKIHPSLIRKQLVYGCEKIAFKYLTAFIACLGIPSGILFNFYYWNHFLALCLLIALWFFCIWILRILAKKDPDFFGVWVRQNQYNRYYPPKTQFFKNNLLKK
jgi:type IV secretory pathway TrbD component